MPSTMAPWLMTGAPRHYSNTNNLIVIVTAFLELFCALSLQESNELGTLGKKVIVISLETCLPSTSYQNQGLYSIIFLCLLFQLSTVTEVSFTTW